MRELYSGRVNEYLYVAECENYRGKIFKHMKTVYIKN